MPTRPIRQNDTGTDGGARPGPPSSGIFWPWPGPAKSSTGAQVPSSATIPPCPSTGYGVTGSLFPPGPPYDDPSKAKKNDRDPTCGSPDMLRPASRQASTIPAASRAPASSAFAASVFVQLESLSPRGEMSPCAPLVQTSTTP